METRYRISGCELMNFLCWSYCKVVTDKYLYELIYRITSGFEPVFVSVLKAELSMWEDSAKKNPDAPFWITKLEKVYDILKNGDKGYYKPKQTILNSKDMNDIRIVLEYCKTIDNPKKKQIAIQPFYEKYKEYSLEVRIARFPRNSNIRVRHDRFLCVYLGLNDEEDKEAGNNTASYYYLEQLLSMWEKDIEPYMRLFAEPQQEESHQNSPAYSGILSEKLVNDMIAQGLIEMAENGLKWLKTKALLAYFAELASEKYRLGKGEYNGKVRTAWKPFETLFGISGLSGARNDNIKTGTQPDGYSQIDELFKE